ncbi:hypothetical protein K443DRAFT_12623 [Laccaria amethystina LaAM-08-1]|uniref:Uncharacterized protein n=1 Tax=Laccaria amethystina LaAM-08-1 TaxID=1095629 RepID=A0A0C9X801_9AGAR|nr:hypothetical protein K443DRAFT_12623 [Laccaria amethystina LaAM-08-1]
MYVNIMIFGIFGANSSRRNFIWDLALTKLYSNCLLSTLNARAELKESSGTYSNHRPRHLSLSGNVEMDMRGFNPPTQAPPPFYELNQTRNTDLEYGITVTKVVETKGDMNSSYHTMST